MRHTVTYVIHVSSLQTALQSWVVAGHRRPGQLPLTLISPTCRMMARAKSEYMQQVFSWPLEDRNVRWWWWWWWLEFMRCSKYPWGSRAHGVSILTQMMWLYSFIYSFIHFVSSFLSLFVHSFHLFIPVHWQRFLRRKKNLKNKLVFVLLYTLRHFICSFVHSCCQSVSCVLIHPLTHSCTHSFILLHCCRALETKHVKSRPITVDDLEARPGSPSMLVVADSESGGSPPPQQGIWRFIRLSVCL